MKKVARHPLSYVMEAADDISYCMSDMEDGIEKGVVTVEGMFRDIRERWKKRAASKKTLKAGYADKVIRAAKLQTVIDPFIAFKTSLINAAVAHAADEYVKGHAQILLGRHGGLVRGSADIVALLKVVRGLVKATVFRSEEAENVELAGYSTICGLLNELSSLLTLPADLFQSLISSAPEKHLDSEMRLVNRLSDKSRKTTLRRWGLRNDRLLSGIIGRTWSSITCQA